MTPRSFTLDELCTLTHLPRRTVRYYVQMGLVERPDGETRAARYSERHLTQLLRIKQLSSDGVSLERIREVLAGGDAPLAPRPIAVPPQSLPGGTILQEPGTDLPQATLAPEPSAALREPAPARVLPTVPTPDSDGDAPAPDSETEDPPLVAAPAAPDPAAAEAAEIAPPAPALIAALMPLSLPPPPMLAPGLTLAAPPAAPPVVGPTPLRPAARALLSPARSADAPLPAQMSLPAAADPEGFASSMPATSAPAALPGEASATAASIAPAPAPAPTFALAPAAPPLAPVQSERAEPRAAPQLESTIAQVGDLREALRATRPELTVRHAEFGFVSLRLEAAGTEGWRAVLASRDPGFVPAIQAALADRAVAAAAAASDSGAFMGQGGAGQHGSGQQGAPQNGIGDHRSGSSPSGGQGSSQPYLGQTGTRDGEAAPDHRRPSTAAALAARAEEGEAPGSPAPQTRGVFA